MASNRTELEVNTRTITGKANKRLRKEGLIPANLYGHQQEPMQLQVDASTFDQLKRQHGERNILALKLPKGRAQNALVKSVQHDPVTHRILHIDFTRVNLTERVTVKIPIHFIGEAPGVKVERGILLHLLEALDIECKASDIVDHLELDISPLVDIGSTLYVRDVTLPEDYTILNDPDEAMVKVVAPKVELPEVETAAAEAEEEAAAEETTEEETATTSNEEPSEA
jgi:large subunit ribosomal protein L25